MKPILSRLLVPCRDERGLILPLALIALLVLAALSGALLAIGSNEAPISANFMTAIQAQYLAEAGLEDAFNAFMVTPTNTFITQNTLTTVSGLNGASTTLLAYGSYRVQYQTVGGNTVRVVATGCVGTSTCPNVSARATKTLTAVYTNNLTITTAVVTQGNTSVGGNTTINGSCGSLHTDGNLSVSGSPTIAQNLTSTGTYTATGNPVIGGTAGGGQPSKTVPAINPADFLTIAKATVPRNLIFQLQANGQVLDGYDSLITTVPNGSVYNGWTYTAGTPASWGQSGNTAINGTYYIQGTASISGSPGSALNPWQTTIIATGDLTITGTPTIQPAVKDTLVVSGGNVSIRGNASLGTSLYNGLVAATGQIQIQGSATINGYIVSGGTSAVTGDTLVGNPTITYNCGSISPPIAGPLTILSWGM